MRFIEVTRTREGRPVDLARVRADLAERLQSVPVDLVYLHGSYAGGKPGPLSDVDVAVLLSESIDDEKRGQTVLDLIGLLADAFEDDGVDIGVLNGASVDFQYAVIRTGVPVYVGDESRRVEFEAAVADRYLDMVPAREEYFRRFRDRILQGGLGARRRTA